MIVDEVVVGAFVALKIDEFKVCLLGKLQCEHVFKRNPHRSQLSLPAMFKTPIGTRYILYTYIQWIIADNKFKAILKLPVCLDPATRPASGLNYLNLVTRIFEEFSCH